MRSNKLNKAYKMVNTRRVTLNKTSKNSENQETDKIILDNS